MKIFLSQLAHGSVHIGIKDMVTTCASRNQEKLLEAIQKTNLDSADLSMYNNGGWD